MGVVGPTAPDSDNTVIADTVEPGGQVSVSISRLSPYVQEFVDAIDSASASPSAARAYFIANSMELRLMDSSDQQVGDTLYVDTSSFNSTWGAATFIAPFANDYTIEVDVYNHQVSTDDPVVSGVSDPFDVNDAGVIDVNVVCKPVSTSTLTVGTASNLIKAEDLFPVDFDINTDSIPHNGGEIWFEFAATPQATIFSIIPEDSEQTGFYFSVFNESGYYLGAGGFDPDSPDSPQLLDLLIPTYTGQTYYIAALRGTANDEGKEFAIGDDFSMMVENWTTSEDLAINGTHYGYYDGLGVYEATFTNTTFTYEYLTPADTYYGSFDVLFYDNDEGFVLLRCTDNNDPEEIGKYQKILWTENSGSYTVSYTETSFDGIHITKTDDFMIEDASVFPTQAEAEALAP